MASLPSCDHHCHVCNLAVYLIDYSVLLSKCGVTIRRGCYGLAAHSTVDERTLSAHRRIAPFTVQDAAKTKLNAGDVDSLIFLGGS